MKKLIKIFLICTFMILALSVTASAETEGYYTYTVSNGKATIIGVSAGISGDRTIPSTLGGYPVTTIGNNAFYNCTSLTSVVIGDSVTTIGEDAFSSCDRLTSVVIGDSVTTIGEDAFSSCDSLTSVVIGDSVTTIGNEAFYYCTKLRGVEIPDSVTTIGNYAFGSCYSLTSVYYRGTKTQWGDISIGSGNNITSANIIYNAVKIKACDENGEILTDKFVDSSKTTYKSIFADKTGYTLTIYADNSFTETIDANSYITKDIEVYVDYVINYTYKFLNDDGSVYTSTTTACGSEIQLPTPPTKLATAQYTYTFKEWEGYTEGMIVTEDVTFKAVYDAVLNQYTYIFYDEDGTTEIKKLTADYGTVIELPQKPEKPADDKYTYEFRNWEGYTDEMLLTEDVTFTAVYDAIYRQNIEIVGETSIVVGNNLTEKISMVTLKPVNYLVCEIIYPDVIELDSIIPKDFKYVSQDKFENKDGMNYLTVICQYEDDETTVPENTIVNPFNLSFTVSKTAKPQEIEIKFGEDTYLSGEEDYLFENKINAKIEILPKLASSVTIYGDSYIYAPTQFTAEVYPDYTADKTIEWTVDDETVATISQDGILTPVKNGSVTITATAFGGAYKTKTVTVYRKAYVDGFKSDVGTWNKAILPDVKEYTIYVTEDTEAISITPFFTTGTLSYNGAVMMKNRAKEFELAEDETTITLTRVNSGYDDCVYTIKVIKTPNEAKFEITDMGEEKTNVEMILPQDMLKEAKVYVLVNAQNKKGELISIKGKMMTNETNNISVEMPKTDKVEKVKAFFWESLANLKPVYAPIEKEF